MNKNKKTLDKNQKDNKVHPEQEIIFDEEK